MPDLSSPGTDSDFYFVQVDDPAIAVSRIVELAKTRIPKRFGLDPIRDIQVLCPMNRGGVGARSLNIELFRSVARRGESVHRRRYESIPGQSSVVVQLIEIIIAKAARGVYEAQTDVFRLSHCGGNIETSLFCEFEFPIKPAVVDEVHVANHLGNSRMPPSQVLQFPPLPLA
jgi:hypothetical protein